MHVRTVGVVGAGAIGMALIRAFEAGEIPGYRLAAVAAREHQCDSLSERVSDGVVVSTDMAAFADVDVDIVVEAAGHNAVLQAGLPSLEKGRDLYLMSIGALADGEGRAMLTAAAERSGARIIVPSGALGGFDGLRAYAQLDLQEVCLTSSKPPHAWSGTLGERMIADGGDGGPVTLFDGNATDAALLYPKNANLAAAVALAGLGFDRTRVRLLSDPAIETNEAELVARTLTSSMTLKVSNMAFADNPKSSRTTAASIAAALLNRVSTITYG